MPRPEKPITGEGPVAEFARQLRALRQAGELSYRDMSDRAHYSASVLSQAAAGERLANWSVVEAYVKACGGNLEDWRSRWEYARAASDERKKRARMRLADFIGLPGETDTAAPPVMTGRETLPDADDPAVARATKTRRFGTSGTLTVVGLMGLVLILVAIGSQLSEQPRTASGMGSSTSARPFMSSRSNEVSLQDLAEMDEAGDTPDVRARWDRSTFLRSLSGSEPETSHLDASAQDALVMDLRAERMVEQQTFKLPSHARRLKAVIGADPRSTGRGKVEILTDGQLVLTTTLLAGQHTVVELNVTGTTLLTLRASRTGGDTIMRWISPVVT